MSVGGSHTTHFQKRCYFLGTILRLQEELKCYRKLGQGQINENNVPKLEKALDTLRKKVFTDSLPDLEKSLNQVVKIGRFSIFCGSSTAMMRFDAITECAFSFLSKNLSRSRIDQAYEQQRKEFYDKYSPEEKKNVSVQTCSF